MFLAAFVDASKALASYRAAQQHSACAPLSQQSLLVSFNARGTVRMGTGLNCAADVWESLVGSSRGLPAGCS
jgi:hypothetical protein